MASKPVSCTYPDCEQQFETKKLMKLHKADDPEHFYCKKCNLDCKDWEDLLAHKVEMMAPWLHGDTEPGEDTNPEHIVCEFCGEDFHTWGGRKRHRLQMHRAPQDIQCPGCQHRFRCGADYIAHLERGGFSGPSGWTMCKVTRREFQSNVKHKNVVNQLMKDPLVFQARLNANQPAVPEPVNPGPIQNRSQIEDQEDGGVSLMDRDEVDRKPTRDEILLPVTRTNLETWPRLPQQSPLQKRDSIRGCVKGEEDALSMVTVQSSINEISSEVTSRRQGNKVHTIGHQSVKSSPTSASNASESRGWRNSDSTKTAIAPSQHAWTGTSTTGALFPGAKLPAAAGDWEAIQMQREAAYAQSTNLFHLRFWDPNAPEYQVDRFWSTGEQCYRCPFPSCDESYLAAADVEKHIQQFHAQIDTRCPRCYKKFKTTAGLVAHMERSEKCGIKYTRGFNVHVNEVTGGFLDAQSMREPPIAAQQSALVRYGQQAGVMDMRYSAKMPDDD